MILAHQCREMGLHEMVPWRRIRRGTLVPSLSFAMLFAGWLHLQLLLQGGLSDETILPPLGARHQVAILLELSWLAGTASWAFSARRSAMRSRAAASWRARLGTAAIAASASAALSTVGACLLGVMAAGTPPWELSISTAHVPWPEFLAVVSGTILLVLRAAWRMRAFPTNTHVAKAVLLPAVFAALTACGMASALGLGAYAGVPLSATDRDRVTVLASTGLSQLYVAAVVGEGQIRALDGRRYSGTDPVEPRGDFRLRISGVAAPMSEVTFALIVTGELADSPVTGPPGLVNRPATFEDYTTGGSIAADGGCDADGRDPNLPPTYWGQSARVVRWVTQADAGGQLDGVTLEFSAEQDYYLPAGNKNIVILPAVTIENAFSPVCSVGHGAAAGDWFPAEQSIIDSMVSAYIPPDAGIDRRPRFDLEEPTLRWVMSRPESFVGGETRSLPMNGSPASLAPSYTISTSATEERAVRATFFAGILAGAAIAAIFEVVRALVPGEHSSSSMAASRNHRARHPRRVDRLNVPATRARHPYRRLTNPRARNRRSLGRPSRDFPTDE